MHAYGLASQVDRYTPHRASARRAGAVDTAAMMRTGTSLSPTDGTRADRNPHLQSRRAGHATITYPVQDEAVDVMPTAEDRADPLYQDQGGEARDGELYAIRQLLA